MVLDTHFPEVVANAVQQMAHDLNWYKAQYEEAVKVIAQLHRGYALPGEPTYIHPADFSEVLDKLANAFPIVDLYKFDDSKGEPVFVSTETGQRFKQSALMPKITKKFD